MSSTRENAGALLLVDGHSLIYRSFYGLRGVVMTDAQGTPTGAVHSFFTTLLKQLDEYGPSHLAICFDLPQPTFRHEAFADYKVQREAMPEDLARQLPILRDCLEALGIRWLTAPGFEADDLLGTVSRLASSWGLESIIMTGDKDAFQLIDGRTRVLVPGSRGAADTLYDEALFRERYGIEPRQFIDVKALMGDPSDNIPGVDGIGEKGALGLIRRYGDLESVIAHREELTPRQRRNLEQQQDQARFSQKLATIKREVPLTLEAEDLILPELSRSGAYALFASYGFQTLIERIGLVPDAGPGAAALVGAGAAAAEAGWSCGVLLEPDCLWRFLAAESASVAAVAERPLYFHVDVADSGFASPEGAALVSWLDADGVEDLAKARLCQVRLDDREKIQSLPALVAGRVARRGETLTGYGLKAWLHFGEVPTTLGVFDLESAAYLLSYPLRAVTGAAALLESLGGKVPAVGQPAATLLEDEEAAAFQERCYRAARELLAATVLEPRFRGEIAERGLEALNRTDQALVPILAAMESRGFLVRPDILEELSADFASRSLELADAIHRAAGREFTIGSPKQLAEVLYEDLKLPTGRKGKSGVYSTAQEELDRLRHLHPIISYIEDYRLLTKLDSTFLQGIKRWISPDDGRVHSTFDASFTNTGRLASRDPNLQNIPVRQAIGREIRRAFVAREGAVLLDADYSQIELRLLAHMSGDPHMIEAFRSGRDIHRRTAARIFACPEDKVTGPMRDAAKTVNFSIVYGISDFSLAQDLGIPIAQARRYIEDYNALYPEVRRFMEESIRLAKERGYSETLFGRRRYIEELKSRQYNLRQFGERAAMNAPVQGTAADIIRMAMVAIARALEREKIRGHLVSQVHDELILEVALEDSEAAAELLERAMVDVVSLDVPLVAEVRRAADWFSAK
ncbi:MAG: DNA polymerase I [Bacillota bacterium]|nr:DNA polymerase I [Bacillota bacterium]